MKKLITFVFHMRSLVFWCLCADNAIGRNYPFSLTDLVSALTLAIAGIQALSLTGLGQAQANARTYQSDMEQNLYRPSAFIVAHLFISLVTEVGVSIIPIALSFFVLGIHKDSFENDFNGPNWVAVLLWFAIVLGFVAVISELIILSVALVTKSYQKMFLIASFLMFFSILLSGGVVRICDDNLGKGVDDIVSVASWTSPSKLALDGLMLLTVKDIVYVNDDATESFPGTEIMDERYCFNTWLHADQDWYVILIMGIMGGIMLIVFFIAARMRAGEAGTK